MLAIRDLALCIMISAIIGCVADAAPSTSAKANQVDCSKNQGGIACAELEILIDATEARMAQTASDVFLVSTENIATKRVGVGLVSSTNDGRAEKMTLRQISDVAFLSGGRDRNSCRLVGERESESFGKFCFYRCGRIEIARARSPAQLCPRRQRIDAAAFLSEASDQTATEMQDAPMKKADPATE